MIYAWCHCRLINQHKQEVHIKLLRNNKRNNNLICMNNNEIVVEYPVTIIRMRVFIMKMMKIILKLIRIVITIRYSSLIASIVTIKYAFFLLKLLKFMTVRYVISILVCCSCLFLHWLFEKINDLLSIERNFQLNKCCTGLEGK